VETADARAQGFRPVGRFPSSAGPPPTQEHCHPATTNRRRCTRPRWPRLPGNPARGAFLVDSNLTPAPLLLRPRESVWKQIIGSRPDENAHQRPRRGDRAPRLVAGNDDSANRRRQPVPITNAVVSLARLGKQGPRQSRPAGPVADATIIDNAIGSADRANHGTTMQAPGSRSNTVPFRCGGRRSHRLR
jgi:hypothetical protein